MKRIVFEAHAILKWTQKEPGYEKVKSLGCIPCLSSCTISCSPSPCPSHPRHRGGGIFERGGEAPGMPRVSSPLMGEDGWG